MSIPVTDLSNLDSDAYIKLAFEVVMKVSDSPYGRNRYQVLVADLRKLLLAQSDGAAQTEPEESLIFVPGMWPNDTGL